MQHCGRANAIGQLGSLNWYWFYSQFYAEVTAKCWTKSYILRHIMQLMR